MADKFPPISDCPATDRSTHSIAADLDGTLLISRSSFPYFMLLAVEAGSPPRGLLLLLSSPLVLLLYKLVSESLAIRLLIYVSTAGIPLRDIQAVSAAVLPRFYAADVREESWRLFRDCGGRRVVVTANPTVMVEAFVKGCLGGDVVLGTELAVDERTGRATGRVAPPGVLVGRWKRDALVREFGWSKEEVVVGGMPEVVVGGMPEVGLGDRDSDRDFMALCKEGYMVTVDPSAKRVSLGDLGTIAAPLQDCYFNLRPDPLHALLTFLWVPFQFALSIPSGLQTSFALLIGKKKLMMQGLRECIYLCNN